LFDDACWLLGVTSEERVAGKELLGCNAGIDVAAAASSSSSVGGIFLVDVVAVLDVDIILDCVVVSSNIVPLALVIIIVIAGVGVAAASSSSVIGLFVVDVVAVFGDDMTMERVVVS